MKRFNDVQVVAAFNSCLDLEKWTALPDSVRGRFKNLLQYHRVKMVCFSDELGVGLRTYRDRGEFDYDDDSDETTLKSGEGLMDLNGLWIRCPASEWEKANLPQFMVMNAKGTALLRDYNEDLDDDGETEKILWTTGTTGMNRTTRATRFDTREEAEARAKEVGGVVIED